MSTYHSYDTYGRRTGSGSDPMPCSTLVPYPKNSAGADKVWAFVDALGQWVAVAQPPEQAPPRGPRKLTRLAFLGRFNEDEQRAIYALAQTNVDAMRWLDSLRMATPDPGTDLAIDLDDPRVAAGLAAFEAAEVLGAGRATEILD